MALPIFGGPMAHRVGLRGPDFEVAHGFVGQPVYPLVGENGGNYNIVDTSHLVGHLPTKKIGSQEP